MDHVRIGESETLAENNNSYSLTDSETEATLSASASNSLSVEDATSLSRPQSPLMLDAAIAGGSPNANKESGKATSEALTAMLLRKKSTMQRLAAIPAPPPRAPVGEKPRRHEAIAPRREDELLDIIRRQKAELRSHALVVSSLENTATMHKNQSDLSQALHKKLQVRCKACSECFRRIVDVAFVGVCTAQRSVNCLRRLKWIGCGQAETDDLLCRAQKAELQNHERDQQIAILEAEVSRLKAANGSLQAAFSKVCAKSNVPRACIGHLLSF